MRKSGIRIRNYLVEGGDLTESSETNNQKKMEIKRKADKMSRVQRTLSPETFRTIIPPAVPKNVRAAKMNMRIIRSSAFHFINACQPVSRGESRSAAHPYFRMFFFSYPMIPRAFNKAMATPIRLSPAIRPDATGMV